MIHFTNTVCPNCGAQNFATWESHVITNNRGDIVEIEHDYECAECWCEWHETEIHDEDNAW